MKSTTQQRPPLAVVAAGGDGKRLGANGPKALVLSADKPLLAWCLDAFAASETFGAGAGDVVVAAHAGSVELFEQAVQPAREAGLSVLVCQGGTSRSHSVANALRAGAEATGAGTRVVLVHDAARPLVSPKLIDGIHDALLNGRTDALVAAAPVTDTIKRVDQSNVVVETPPRESLWAVQTPQAFRSEVLERALGLSERVADEVLAAASDDASLVEASGGSVAVYPWAEPNFKVTTAADLRSADRCLRSVD